MLWDQGPLQCVALLQRLRGKEVQGTKSKILVKSGHDGTRPVAERLLLLLVNETLSWGHNEDASWGRCPSVACRMRSNLMGAQVDIWASSYAVTPQRVRIAAVMRLMCMWMHKDGIGTAPTSTGWFIHSTHQHGVTVRCTTRPLNTHVAGAQYTAPTSTGSRLWSDVSVMWHISHVSCRPPYPPPPPPPYPLLAVAGAGAGREGAGAGAAREAGAGAGLRIDATG